MGTISSARADLRMTAAGVHTGTNVAGAVEIGESIKLAFPTADIAYSLSITGAGAGDVATLTLSTGATAQTTGTPTIADAGEDFEGDALAAAATIYGLGISCDDNGTGVTVELKDDGTTVGEWSSDGAGLKALHAYETGLTAADKTLVVTMAGFLTASLTTGSGDAGITWTAAAAGSAGNAITVVTADAAASAVTTVAEAGNAITVTRAAKARMLIGGTLTSDGSTPVVIPDLFYAGINNDKPSFESPVDPDSKVVFDGAKWVLEHSGGSTWHGDVLTVYDSPDEVATWVAQGTASGIPTFEPASSTAAQVHAAASSLTVATSALVGTGADTFAAVTPAQNLTGGVGTGQPVTKITILAKTA